MLKRAIAPDSGVAVLLLWLALWAAATAPGVEAQTLQGRVVADPDSAPLSDVAITVTSRSGEVLRAMSAAGGGFRVVLPAPGEYRVRAELIGYATIDSVAVEVVGRETVEVTLRLATRAVPLEPLTVTARRPSTFHDATYEGFYARYQSTPSVGNSRVIMRTDPELTSASRITQVLEWMPRDRRPGACTIYFLNGRLSSAETLAQLPMVSVLGVEYYRQGSLAPFGFREQTCVNARYPEHSVVAVWLAPEGTTSTVRGPQVVAGRLLDDRTREPIAHGAIHLLGRDGRKLQSVVTDTAGRFRFGLRDPGEFRMRAERLGYETSETRNIKVLPGDTLAFDFWLSTSAVLLAPIEVTASARDWIDRYAPAGLAPFYERRTFYEKLGTGSFYTRAALSEWEGVQLTSLLGAIAGVSPDGRGNIVMRAASSGGFNECAPQYYLNGAPYSIGGSLDQAFRPEDLEGIEVYRGAAQVPGEFAGSTAACGVVVLWTRRTR